MAALYALGALTQHEVRAFENLLADDNNGLAEELAAFEAVTTHLAFAAPEHAPSFSARESLLTRITQASHPAITSKEPQLQFVSPEQASQVFSVHANEGEWVEVGPGLTAKTLFVDQRHGTITSLVKMAPGGALPPHRHLGNEQFYILEGDCSVQGAQLGPGDFHSATAGTVHESTSTVKGTTFLLIAPADYEILQSAIH